MKKIDYSNGNHVIIIEPEDNILGIYTKLVGERAELVCIPIKYKDDKKLSQFIPALISVGGEFFGGIFYYTTLKSLDQLLHPLTYGFYSVPISASDSYKAKMKQKQAIKMQKFAEFLKAIEDV